MSILVSAHQLTKSFASKALFDGITFSIESGDRIGLIGPNGAGKSTLLKILAKLAEPDAGDLSFSRGLRVGYLEQTPLFQKDATVMSSIMEAAHDVHDWEEIALAQELMSKLSLSPENSVAELSGGWRKRVALARELLRRPDLLLLDEPTNHLDIESVLWLENFLAQASFASLTVTHDRAFLQAVSTRILELDRRNPDGLLSVLGTYADYLDLKEQTLASQLKLEDRLRNTLRRETEWLRRGPKARTTKQQARIQRAGQLGEEMEEVSARNQKATAQIDFQTTGRSPKKLIDAEGISKSYNGRLIIPPLDLIVTPESRIGLLGANGCGKSTLIRILLGEETPDSGTVKRADGLKAVYFEQGRESLDPHLTVLKTVCPSGEYVDFRGAKVHVRTYLGRFLFGADEVERPVAKLSGGEQSRLLLARLMLQECNLLVLDEPTNDLDTATLDVLEDTLREFNGAVILVTHDRYFLDQVTKTLLAFGSDTHGKKEIVSLVGLSQWENWREERRERLSSAPSPATEIRRSLSGKAKLSYKEQREFDGMESAIEQAEAELARLSSESEKAAHAGQHAQLAELTRQMGAAQAEIDRLYARWTELESKKN